MTMNSHRLILRLVTLFYLFFLLFAPHPASALTSEAVSDDLLSVKLLSAKDSIQTQAEITLGLDVQLAPETHTYWRTPGAAGSAPKLDWSQSSNLSETTFHYPAPTRISMLGMETIGYENRVIFPIQAKIKDPAQPLALRLSLDMLVCKELCLPKHFDLMLDIPSGSDINAPEATLLDEAVRLLPSEKRGKVSITNLTRTENKVYVEIASIEEILAPDLFIETEENIIFGKPEVSIDPNKHKAFLTATLEGLMPDGKTLTQTPLTLTVTNGMNSTEQRLSTDGVVSTQNGEPAPSSSQTKTLVLMLLFALLGGLILNLMPCVLPVLSLKLFSLLKHGGAEHSAIRHSFFSTAGGIIISFLILALATLALKAGGASIGWGVQFQQPTFLVFMIVLLTLFTANLWGFFNITMPRFVMDSVDPLHHPKLAGDFATGMLATLLATPCSAPFLGTAVAFALAAGATEILSIFFMLGLGMALPYIAIAIWPKLAAVFPKPGNWMTVLTRILGFGMGGTAIWLLWVLYGQIGKQLTALITLGMTAILFQLYLRHRNFLRIMTWPVIILIFSASFLIGLAATVPERVANTSGVWEKFDEATLHRHVREGKVVFVDITADWCITCKANKRFTLARDEVSEKIFNNERVVAMQGDWSSPDPVITTYLQKFDRYGIPFNVVYGPKAPKGIVLPEILTPSIVLNALEQAKGPSRNCPVSLPDGRAC